MEINKMKKGERKDGEEKHITYGYTWQNLPTIFRRDL
jgi:hypothetical protein